MTFGLSDVMQLSVLIEEVVHAVAYCLYWVLTGTVQIEVVSRKGVGQTVKAEGRLRHVMSFPEQALTAAAVGQPGAVAAMPET